MDNNINNALEKVIQAKANLILAETQLKILTTPNKKEICPDSKSYVHVMYLEQGEHFYYKEETLKQEAKIVFDELVNMGYNPHVVLNEPFRMFLILGENNEQINNKI